MPRPWLRNETSTPPLDPPPGGRGSATPAGPPPPAGVALYLCEGGHVTLADTLPRDDAVIFCPRPIAQRMQCGRRARRQ